MKHLITLICIITILSGCTAQSYSNAPITPAEQRQMQDQAEMNTWLQLFISLIPSAIILADQ